MMVAQVDEHQAAVVALPVNPSGQPHITPCVRQPEVAASVGAIGVHGVQESGFLG